MANNVTYQHPNYRDNLATWQLIDDCVAGQREVKGKRETYLPKPNASDTSEENRVRYEQYLTRAIYYNVTGRTLRGLVGEVFAKETTHEVPELLDAVVENADGTGVNLIQQAKEVVGLTLGKGRAGLLVDYPKTEGAVTLQQQRQGEIYPNIFVYEPEEITNWDTMRIGSRTVLSLVVLRETFFEDETNQDSFVKREAVQYRVLRLDEAGFYCVDIYREDATANRSNQQGVSFSLNPELSTCPTDSAGNRLREIPFVFAGSENNDYKVDDPPMYDLAEINLGHYRNSADYEEAVYIVGQPTPYFSGIDQTYIEDVWKGTVQLGSRAAIPLPDGASAGLLQANPNPLPKEAMEAKERQMVALGAKLVEQQQVARTATEAAMENATETSILANVTRNVSAAYQKALEFAANFAGANGDITFELNTDFTTYSLDPQALQALVAAWQQEAITFAEVRDNLLRAGIASEQDAEAARTIIESENPVTEPITPFQLEDGE